jgi:hypothetical protein
VISFTLDLFECSLVPAGNSGRHFLQIFERDEGKGKGTIFTWRALGRRSEEHLDKTAPVLKEKGRSGDTRAKLPDHQLAAISSQWRNT